MTAWVCFLFNQRLIGQNTTYINLVTESVFDSKQINTNLPVGSLIANAGDNGGGGASYSIPITLPSGSNEVIPSLSIIYSSFTGDGLLGRGWALSGLSSISRVSKNRFFDGNVQPIEMGENDVFAFDGSRMFLKNTGVYGADGMEYRTEVETFSVITSKGNIGGGPEWFEIWTKDGTKMEFGNTSDSRLTSAGISPVLSWRINKIRYPDGNFISFSYTSNIDNASQIATIEYTGNDLTGRSPFNKVTFTYSERQDITTSYPAISFPSISKFLLDKITITTTDDNNILIPFKEYQLRYGYNGKSSFLRDIAEKGADGVGLNTTIFKYGDDPDFVHSSSVSVNLLNNSFYDFFPVDFDADGRSDILAVKKEIINNVPTHTEARWFRRNASAASTYSQTAYTSIGSGFTAFEKGGVYKGHNFLTSDFNGDGGDDLFVVGMNYNSVDAELVSMSYHRFLGPPNALTGSTSIPLLPVMVNKRILQGNNAIRTGDFDGDGKSDVFIVLRVTIPSSSHPSGQIPAYKPFVYLSSLQSFFEVNLPPSGAYYWWDIDALTSVDFDGDGDSELLVTKGSQSDVHYFQNPNNSGNIPNTILYTSNNIITKDYLQYPGDFNGDGKTDILIRKGTSNSAPWFIYYGTGATYVQQPFTFQAVPNVSNVTLGPDNIFISDFDGDGRMDVCHTKTIGQTNPTNRHDYYYSTGNNFLFKRYSIPYDGFFTRKSVTFDFSGDGKSDFLRWNSSTFEFRELHHNQYSQELLLHKVKNGIGHITEFAYNRMTDGAPFYTRAQVSTDAIRNIQLPLHLLASVKKTNAIGGFMETTFQYDQAKFHRLGKGIVGFRKTTTIDQTNYLKTEKEYKFHSIYIDPYLEKTRIFRSIPTQSDILLEESVLTAAHVGISNFSYWVKMTSIQHNKVLEGVSNNSNFYYDSFGNVILKDEFIHGSSASNALDYTETELNFVGHPTTPVPSKPLNTIIIRRRQGQPQSVISYKTFTYTSLGQLNTETENCCFATGGDNITTDYDYFPNGNLQSVQIIPPGNLGIRTTTFGYDIKGRFQTTLTNTLNQTSSATYDPRWGTPLSTTGIGGLTTTYQYDAFGRRTQTNFPEGYSITETYGWDVNGTEGTIDFYQISQPGRPTTKTWRDVIGRKRKVQRLGAQNTWVTELTTYDYKGNLKTQTAPFESSEVPLLTTYNYDDYNRPFMIVTPYGTTTTAYAYSSGQLTTTVTAPDGNTTFTTTDASGKVITAGDNGGILNYVYDSRANIRHIINNNGVTILSTEYDGNGREKKLIDQNGGITEYKYDALGHLYEQKNANGQITTQSFDLLGRIISRSEIEGTTIYTYLPSGPATNNINTITSNYVSTVTETYQYDAFGRLNRFTQRIDNKNHLTRYLYNTYGDIRRITYPSGVIVNYEYDAAGYLLSLKNFDNTITLYHEFDRTGLGKVKSFSLGNASGSTIDYNKGFPTRYYTAGKQDLQMNWNMTNGNLNNRNDVLKGRFESFQYDNLNRLKKVQPTGIPNLDIDYSPNGNISQKSDAGTYAYSTNKPNAVSLLTNIQGNIPAVAQNITYNSFLQPTIISEGPHELILNYGPNHQRIKTTSKVNGTEVNRRYFLGGYELDETIGGTTRHIHYISTPGNAMVIIVKENTGSEQYHYAYTDHLGSILTVTNQQGAVIAEQNFDAWGRQRNPSTWQYNNIPSVPIWLYRGYTGHEHLPQFGLINMNGRLYDPVLGRMLSVDNYIQEGAGTQGYNRYSYALNNPLKYTDPNGEIVMTAIMVAFFSTMLEAAFTDPREDFNFGGKFLINAVSGIIGGGITNGIAAVTNGLSFASGFTSFTPPLGFTANFLSQAGGSAARGFTATTLNSLQNGEKMGNSVLRGLKSGLVQGLSAGIIGGISGGISAVMDHRDFRTGIPIQYKAQSAYVADLGGSSSSEVASNLSAYNGDDKSAYFRAEDGTTSIKNVIKPHSGVKTRIDGFATSKSLTTGKVLKVADYDGMAIIHKGGDVNFDLASDRAKQLAFLRTSPITGRLYGWHTKEEYISKGWYYDKGGAPGWERLFNLIPHIK